MRIATVVTYLVLAASLGGCGGDAAPPAEDAASRQTAPAAGSGRPGERACALFTQREIGELLGATVPAGRVTGPGGTACHWDGSSASTAVYAQVQLLEPGYWAASRESVPIEGVGIEAFSASVLPGEWAAAALTAEHAVNVTVNAPGVTRETAVRMLRMAVDRL